MFFFVFTLIEVLWGFDLQSMFFINVGKFSIIIQVFLLSFSFSSPPGTLLKHSLTEISYSVIILPVFQVRKFLLLYVGQVHWYFLSCVRLLIRSWELFISNAVFFISSIHIWFFFIVSICWNSPSAHTCCPSFQENPLMH